MVLLITSCGRPDLLKKTVDSILKNRFIKNHINFIIIHEDSESMLQKDLFDVSSIDVLFCHTNKIGQHASIELFLKNQIAVNKYYLHLEDDFEFLEDDFDWIQASIDIMNADDKIIKVLARKDSQHPCVHDQEINGIKYGILDAFWHHEGITWKGFSWNCGVTRLDHLKQFIPFRKWEQDVAEDISDAGFKIAELERKVYHHIGDGRSTHN